MPSPPAPFRVAVAQVDPTLGDLPANLRIHVDQIARAGTEGADLVVFPELSLTGYYLKDQVPEVAEPRDGPLIRAVAEAAAAAGVAAVVGFVEEDRAANFYNAAAFVDAGSETFVHRKVYLPTYGMFDERRYFAAGDRIRAFDTRFGRVGLLVCEDAWHLSCGVILQADGIDLLILIANSPARGVREEELGSRSSWRTLAQTYAMYLNVPVVFSNRVGFEDGVGFWGGSVVYAPGGETLVKAPGFEPALVVAPIDPRSTRLQRILAPIDRDERLHLTLDELERIRHGRIHRDPRD